MVAGRIVELLQEGEVSPSLQRSRFARRSFATPSGKPSTKRYRSVLFNWTLPVYTKPFPSAAGVVWNKATIARQLREVQSGEAIVPTEHKRPIAVVQPVTGDNPVERPSSNAFKPPKPVSVPSFRGSVTELLSEERADS